MVSKVMLGAPAPSWSLVKRLVEVGDLFPLPPLLCHQQIWEL